MAVADASLVAEKRSAQQRMGQWKARLDGQVRQGVKMPNKPDSHPPVELMVKPGAFETSIPSSTCRCYAGVSRKVTADSYGIFLHIRACARSEIDEVAVASLISLRISKLRPGRLWGVATDFT